MFINNMNNDLTRDKLDLVTLNLNKRTIFDIGIKSVGYYSPLDFYSLRQVVGY